MASLVTTKGIISSSKGWTAQYANHRPGVLCRTLGDAAQVLDAMKDPEEGYFDSDDVFGAAEAVRAERPVRELRGRGLET